MSLLRTVTWAVLAWAPLVAEAGDVTHALSTTSGSVEFTVSEKGLWLSRYTVNRRDEARVWVEGGPTVPLWSVTIQEYSGDRSVVTALSGPPTVSRSSPERLEASWKDLGRGDVAVTLTVTVRGDDLVWGLEASAQAPDCALWSVTFPEVGPLTHPEATHSITPRGWGVTQDRLTERPLYDRVYPSANCALPFVAVSDGRAGLYLGVEDPAGHPVRLFVGKGSGASTVTLGMRHDLPDMGRVRHYRIPYAPVVTAYTGDWYEAAQLYRRAAAKTPWGAVSPLTERRDIPAWLTATDLWYTGPCDDEKTAVQAIAFAQYFGVPTAAHVYSWHQIPFDDHYPEYFPMKPGFGAAVTRVQAAGIPVMPYINSRLWDAATTSWEDTHARQAAALGYNGRHYAEIYGPSVPLTPMCPTTTLWQDTVVELVDRLVKEVGVRGVYLDQIAAAPPCRCFAPDHGHPPGGGAYWTQGYRDLLRRCLAVLPPGSALTTEENADPWNDQLHAFLVVNTPARAGQIVPLYPAVYGGRVVSFGFQYLSDKDFDRRYPGRLKFAQAFAFGSQLGWVGASILNAGYEREAAFLRRLCQVRHQARDALQFGRLLPPVGLDGVAEVSWTEEVDGSPRAASAPAVVATAWLTPGGQRKLAAANVADEAVSFTLSLDSRHAADPMAETLALRSPASLARPAETVAVLRRANDGAYRGELNLPAREALTLEIVAAPH